MFINGNFLRLREQQPEPFGCGGVGWERWKGALGWGEGGCEGGEALAETRAISSPASKVMHWLIQVQEPCTGDILQPFSKSSLCSNGVGAIL